MGWLGRLWRSTCAYARKVRANHLARGGPWYRDGALHWYRDGNWVRLTPDEEADHVRDEAW